MADLAKVKRNVAKMVSMNAPEADIDAYISSEGTSIDAIRSFRETPQQPQTKMAQRFPLATKGVQQAKSGETIAGGLNIANQGFAEIARPFQMADEALRKVPVAGVGLSNLLRIPPYLASKAVELGTSAISSTGIPQALNRLAPIDESGQMGEAMGNINQSIAPFLVAPPIMRGVAKTPEMVGRGAQTVANALSQSAYKIPPSIKAGERQQILRTAQKENIVPTKKGLEKIDSKVSELKSATEALERTAKANNTNSVPTASVLANIDALTEKWSKSDTPTDFINILEGYRKKVLQQQKPELGIQDMVDLKRNLQRQLSDVYVKQMKINPSIRQNLLQEAKSSVENSVREKLETLIPEYADKNSQIHKLLKLKPYVEQSANRISNQDLTTVRLKDVMLGGGVAGLGADPISIAASIAIGRILTDQRVQAYLANKIAPTGKIPSGINRVTTAFPSTTRTASQLPIYQQEDNQ